MAAMAQTKINKASARRCGISCNNAKVMIIEFARMKTTKIASPIARAVREPRDWLRLAIGSVVTLPPSRRLTLALSGRPQRSQARGRRKMAGAPDARPRGW